MWKFFSEDATYCAIQSVHVRATLITERLRIPDRLNSSGVTGEGAWDPEVPMICKQTLCHAWSIGAAKYRASKGWIAYGMPWMDTAVVGKFKNILRFTWKYWPTKHQRCLYILSRLDQMTMRGEACGVPRGDAAEGQSRDLDISMTHEKMPKFEMCKIL